MMQTIRRIVLAMLFVAILLLPALPSDTPNTQFADSNVDLVFIVDRTTSMAATDYDGGHTRLEGVAEDIRRVTELAPQARYSVVTIDNRAQLALPPTNDAAALTTLAETLGWRDEQQGSGTDIGIATDVVVQLLQSSQQDHPRNKRYVIYMGDGEQTARSAPTSLAPIRQYTDGAQVFGYGTAEGATMLARPGSSELLTRNGEHPISKIDEGNLQKLAAELGGQYQHRTGDEELALWPGITADVEPDPQHSDEIPVVWILGIVAAALTCWDLLATIRQARKFWLEVR